MSRVTVQFMLPKFAIALMFAQVTVNFNRVAIVEYQLPALLIALMIGLYPFFGPFQPFFGKMTDRFPIFGYRRSPYLLIGLMTGSFSLLPLPFMLEFQKGGNLFAIPLMFLLFFIFGLSIALMANTYLDLIAECTTAETRSKVFAAAWTGQTLILVVWASLFGLWMPEFSESRLQSLYLISPLIVFILGFLGIFGLERRLTKDELRELTVGNQVSLPAGQLSREQNPFKDSLSMLLKNATAKRFFLFISLSFFGIFTQDLLQEVMGAEIFHLSVSDSSIFQQLFNTGVTLGMGMTAALGAKLLGKKESVALLEMRDKKSIATFGGMLAALSFGLIAFSILYLNLTLAIISFGINGFCVGIFTMAAVTMMSDMTVKGQTGKYLGIWSMAQAFGLGGCFILCGLIYEVIIGSSIFSSAPIGYAAFFLAEGFFMILCVISLRPASIASLERDAIKNEVTLMVK
ncbi:MAG: MFS transporter [Chloroherpetonaceae bacterium]|nr:MFS transporter [Chloroherpetonaceae bacterium]